MSRNLRTLAIPMASSDERCLSTISGNNHGEGNQYFASGGGDQNHGNVQLIMNSTTNYHANSKWIEFRAGLITPMHHLRKAMLIIIKQWVSDYRHFMGQCQAGFGRRGRLVSYAVWIYDKR